MKKRGFSLSEVLVAVVVIAIVTGAVSMTVTTAMKNYSRVDAHTRAVNAARYTAESLNRNVTQPLSVVKAIEILPDNTFIPAVVTESNDKYLFLKGDSLAIRSTKGDTVLPGSELVADFRVESLHDVSGDYSDRIVNLAFTTAASAEDADEAAPLASYDISMDVPMLNMTSRYGSVSVTREGKEYYTGKALKFTFAYEYELELDNLHLRNADKDSKINAYSNIKKGARIETSYDILPKEDANGEELLDKSTYEWFIASISTNITDIKTGEPTSAARMAGGCWQLVDNSGNPITTRILPTSAVFYVKTSSGRAEWGKYGLVYCRVSPKIAREDGSGEKTIESVNTYYVGVTRGEGYENAFYRDMREALMQYQENGARTPGFPVNAGAARVVVDDEGNAYIQIQYKADGSITGSTVAGRIMMYYLSDAISRSKEDGKSYTSPANYTVIVDARLDSTSSGYGVLLNGVIEEIKLAGNNNYRYNDSGYMFQYDKNANGYPIRFFAQGNHNQDGVGGNGVGLYGIRGIKGTYIGAYGAENVVAAKTVNYNDSNSYGGPYYEPAYLKTKEFTYNNNSYGGNNGTATDYKNWWNPRRRFALTILEYYTESKDKVYPCYIIRAKHLKNFPDDINYETTRDPLGWGEEYFESNPAWFGNFRGSDVAPGASGTIYTHSAYNGNKWSNSTGKSLKDLYLTKSPKSSSFNSASSNHKYGIFQATPMDIRADFTNPKTAFMVQHSDFPPDKDKAQKLFQNPKRDRSVGFRVWNASIENGAKIFNLTLAPGFTKEELRAILPKGAKLYEFSDVLSESDYEEIKKNPMEYGFSSYEEVTRKFNEILSGSASDGKGNGSGITNGVNGIQYRLNSDGTNGKWHGFVPTN